MCKEMPVILVNKGVDPKRIIRKKLRAEEEERHKGSLTKKNMYVFLGTGMHKGSPNAWTGIEAWRP
jgi:hypothetical protein